MRFPGLLVMILLLGNYVSAQTCSTLGQTPATAFPVCGENTFTQTNVPICVTHRLTVPGCQNDGNAYQDKNPYWYSFTCYQSGTLGFLITPNNLGDDYDWMLYDITGHDPNEVFTNTALIVTGNWAGTYGVTGASSTGVAFIQCASDPVDKKNSFSTMPTLVAGHQYLLLVSHFTDSQSGYTLSFGGGTASITDPLQPAIKNGWAGCGGVSVTIVFNKKLKCSSLAANASDFVLSPAAATIVSASGTNCSNSFNMDTVVLTMSNALPPGTYSVAVKKGSDANTLLDNCDKAVAEGDHISFTVDPVQPTPMDSIVPVGCAPGSLQLVFSKPMDCSAIAANGSDFVITGPTPVTITGATGNCVQGVTTTITLHLSAPIQTAGTYQVKLVTGNDNNTVIDECGQQTPTGATVNFTTHDTVNAGFTYDIVYGCRFDTVHYHHNGANGVNQWQWTFDGSEGSAVQNPTYTYSTFGNKNIQLIVSNGVCSDTAAASILLDNELKAAFGYPDILCPQDKAVFTDSSIGKIVSWNWDFGNGSTSTLQNPLPETYPALVNERTRVYTIQLIVENNIHCFDTVSHSMKVVNSCFIAVPNAFTPNNDGRNDYLYPLNAWKAVKLEFYIYNRYGQVVFHTNDWTKKWDGTINGQAQATGVYVWTLRYTDSDTGQQFFKRGTTVLIR
jgi:gliding motility-associated-like protein